MRFLILPILILVVCNSCKKDPETVIPDPLPKLASFEGEIGVNDNSTIASNDGNLLLCGNTTGGMSILKIMKAGSLIWRKDIGGTTRIISGIAESTSHDIYLTGTDLKKSDLLFVKANAQGDTIWSKTFGNEAEDWGDYIIALRDGNLLICGRTCSNIIPNPCGIYLLKIKPDGDTLWTKSFFDDKVLVPKHLLETTDGEYLITGMAIDDSFERRIYFLKVNPNGIQKWNKTLESTSDEFSASTIELSNGDLITCGGIVDTLYNQILLLKTDKEGNLAWKKEFGENYISEAGTAIVENQDGTYTLTGGSLEIHTGQRNVLILKFDQDGTLLVNKEFGHTLVDYGQNILKDNNGENFITGQYNGKIFLTRTDENCVFQ